MSGARGEAAGPPDSAQGALGRTAPQELRRADAPGLLRLRRAGWERLALGPGRLSGLPRCNSRKRNDNFPSFNLRSNSCSMSSSNGSGRVVRISRESRTSRMP